MAKLIVIDDDPDMLDVLHDYLTEHGYQIECASSGDEAIRKIKNDSQITCGLMDIAMPNKNGIETLTEIKIINPNYRAIMITAYRDDELINAALKAGAIKCMYKPFDMKNILQVVQTTLLKPD